MNHGPSFFKPNDTTSRGNSRPGAVQAFARQFTREAIERLVSIMRDDTLPARVRMEAIRMLLDRAYGRPAQSIGTSEPPPLQNDNLTYEEAKQRLLDMGIDIKRMPLLADLASSCESQLAADPRAEDPRAKA